MLNLQLKKEKVGCTNEKLAQKLNVNKARMQGNKIARDNHRIYPVGCLKCLDGLNVWPRSATNHVNTRQVNSDFLQKRLGPNHQVDSMP